MEAARESTGTVVGKALKHFDKYGNAIATTVIVRLNDLVSGAETKCEIAMDHDFARHFALGDPVAIQIIAKQASLALATERSAARHQVAQPS